jgi:CheY-like chemotaxis protein
VVRDTGIGIPADEQKRIFEAFTQVNNSTTREYSGTGLGLAISQRLAVALGGTLGVESVEGGGSCFTLALPVERVGNGLVVHEAELPGASLEAARLLLVEANEAAHPMLRMLLGAETRSIDIVRSGEEALAAMAAGAFDHVMIEAYSAAGDSPEPLDAIRAVIARAREHHARISLLAAPSERLGLGQLATAGADQFILKPVGAADLIAALKKLYEAPAEAAAAEAGGLRATS